MIAYAKHPAKLTKFVKSPNKFPVTVKNHNMWSRKYVKRVIKGQYYMEIKYYICQDVSGELPD